MSDREKVLLTCPHCGNKTPMRLLNQYRHHTCDSFEGHYEIDFEDIFEVFECPTCSNINLFYTTWNSEDAFYLGDYNYEGGEFLFPVEDRLNTSRLPTTVKNAYDSALRVRNIDNTMCMVGLRRALEKMCKDKGATKGQLHQKINELQQKNILPPLMGDISSVLKDIGNMAAHADEVEFEKRMVNSMFRFTNKILEYVYLLPNELKRARQEIELLSERAEAE
ncbi:DUF4145 domain-containing protein [Halobacillus sp. B29]|uniref:DUF4145 domain-containing protein n=1 Tax=Halobacillus sp. B29 TaxID=3457432 RepID=UPI003FCDB916